MTDGLTEIEKQKIARGLVDVVVKECERHGVEFVSLPMTTQRLIQQVAQKSMIYGANAIMEAVKNEKDN